MRKKKLNRKIILFAIAAIVIVGILIIRPRFAKEEALPIETAKVERGNIISSVSGDGILQPISVLELKSNVGGQVMEMTVDEGDAVEAGQLIAKIDPSDTISILRQAEAEYLSARSNLDQAIQGYNMQKIQTTSNIKSSEQGLESSRQKYLQSEQQAKIQPKLTAESIAQAESLLESANANLAQVKNSSIPQAIASAKSSYESANASYEKSRKDLERQKALLVKGFVSAGVVDDAEAQLAVSKAQLETAKSRYDTIKNETDQELRNAQLKIDQAKSSLETAKANRIQDDIKKRDLAASAASLNQAKSALASAKSSKYQDQIKAGSIINARAQLEKAKAALQNAQTQLTYTTITTPRAGIIVNKYVEEGSIVTAGRQAMAGSGSGVTIVEIADVSKMWVVVNIDETDISKIKFNQDVNVTIDAFPESVFKGKVIKIAPGAIVNQNVTTIPVTVEISKFDARLKPDMNASCDFIIDKKIDVLTLPVDAITETKSGVQVTVLKNGNSVTRTIKTGITDNDNIEVVSGLKEGDVVLIPTDISAKRSMRQMRGPSGPPPMKR